MPLRRRAPRLVDRGALVRSADVEVELVRTLAAAGHEFRSPLRLRYRAGEGGGARLRLNVQPPGDAPSVYLAELSDGAVSRVHVRSALFPDGRTVEPGAAPPGPRGRPLGRPAVADRVR